jgi:hypothetical protein
MCQLGLFKTYLYSKDNDAMIKDFKLKVLICFKSSITTEPPYTKHPISFSPFLYQIEQVFGHWKG